MRDSDSTAAISVVVLWLVVLVAAAFVIVGTGLVAASVGTVVSLSVLGGVLFLAARSFVRYYGGDRRLF